ncbi:dihydrofolate reductase family protein [Leucobacter luti]|uniref:Dihydrofolate reductase n=1 Tax=Leucobacter luti TaxID=340320 RepID=A0A4R6RTU3_9MICO|nr:dihydrofolate reductase family protein [Leucobacter luti]QYM75948.1 dihydrofolate reductase family protein [Leucobacter luti]TDP90333.1 dihydrofolate reductase [Leucobacter luti]
MSKVIYYVAATIDGYIADPSDSLDWLMRHELEPGGTNDYESFLGTVGAIVMGATTYEWVLTHGPWGYELPAWVMTHRELPLPQETATGAAADIRFSQAEIRQVHQEMLVAAKGKDLWVVGGGDLAGQFADAGLLDEILLSTAPVTLGAGRPVLPRRLDLELLETARNGAFAAARYRVLGQLQEDRSAG